MAEPELAPEQSSPQIRRTGWIVWAFFCLSVPAFWFIGWRDIYIDLTPPEGSALSVRILHQVAALAAGLVAGLRFLRWRRDKPSARLIHLIIAAPFATVVVLMGYLEKTVYNPASETAIFMLWAGALLHLLNTPFDL